MSDLVKVTLRPNEFNLTQVCLDGIDVTKGCYRVEYVHDVLDCPRLTLHYFTQAIDAETAAHLTAVMGEHRPSG